MVFCFYEFFLNNSEMVVCIPSKAGLLYENDKGNRMDYNRKFVIFSIHVFMGYLWVHI